MITGKINLRQLNHALMTTPKGAKVVVIPIAENNLFEGEKGIYLDLIAFELKNPEAGKDTHLVKQSFSKEVLEAMDEEKKKNLPILGNLRVSEGGARGEAPPADLNAGKVATGLDDLPF